MVPVTIAGNISGEATPPSGNIFNEATRGSNAVGCLRLASRKFLESRMHNDKAHIRFGERPCETTGRETGRRAWPTPPKLKGPAKRTCFHLYVILDIFSRYVVGWMIAARESAELAEQIIADTAHKQHIVPGTLTLHADRGGSMRSKPVAALLVDLDISKTHSRPHSSDHHGLPSSKIASTVGLETGGDRVHQSG